MSSIFRRGNKFYCCFKNAEGRWIKKVGGNTREEALRSLEYYQSCPSGSTNPFAPIAAAYLAKLRIYAKPRSHAEAKASCQRLTQHFESAPFDQSGLDSFISGLLSQVSRKTINNHLICLRAACHYGIQSGKLERLPFRITLLKTTKKRALPVLGKDEIERLLASAKDPWFGILLVCAYTGFRISEALHLSWQDINPQDCSLSVTGKNGWTSKSHQERTVFVPARVIEYLQERRKKARFKEDEDYVFATRNGTPITQDNACRAIRKVFKRAGLYRKGQPLTHLLRHSVISQMLMNGVDVETAREISGHASLTTLALYARTVAEKKKQAASALPWSS